MQTKKIPVGILGATGSVGQRFVQLLADHPWFEITDLAASPSSVGQKYRDIAKWFMSTPMPEHLAELIIKECKPDLNCRIVFSGLDNKVAGEIESNFARAGYIVISNSKNHRMDDDVPLVVPEINGQHLDLIKTQSYGRGCIVTNPNCSTIGLVMALKPLLDNFGLEAVNVVTMQALSGAGYPGVASLDIIDNVIPYIGGEEEKLQSEPLKIFGEKIKISASCNRVAVIDGHMECLSVSLKHKASAEDLIKAWTEFRAEPQDLDLPMAPIQPIHYFEEAHFPQPKRHRELDKGMAISIGRLRECSLFDYKFVILSHNTVRGAAGCAILIAELMLKKGMVD